MATTFEPRTSFRSSQTRHPISSMPPSTTAAEALPSIDFGFEDLRKRMTAFTTRFDDFIASGRKSVLAERNEHRSRLAELQESHHNKETSIRSLSTSATTLSSTLAREAAETSEMHHAISALTLSRDSHATRNANLTQQLASTQAAIATRLAAQQVYADQIAAQSSKNGPELAFFEEYLGMRIESPADDQIAFVFCCVDERDAERECEVVLDLSRRDYEVKRTRPAGLEGSEEVVGALERLNEGRDLGPFLKEMRGIFRKALRQ